MGSRQSASSLSAIDVVSVSSELVNTSKELEDTDGEVEKLDGKQDEDIKDMTGEDGNMAKKITDVKNVPLVHNDADSARKDGAYYMKDNWNLARRPGRFANIRPTQGHPTVSWGRGTGDAAPLMKAVAPKPQKELNVL